MDKYKFVEPKTQASNRVIDTDTIRELKEWKEVQQKFLKDCGFVMSYSGVSTSKHTLPRALNKLAELAGVHSIKIHALRHSHASLLISMGENPLIIKDRLGHENSKRLWEPTDIYTQTVTSRLQRSSPECSVTSLRLTALRIIKATGLLQSFIEK